MPELPELETIRRHLENHLPGSTVVDVRLRRRDVLRNPSGHRRGGGDPGTWLLKGQMIESIQRRGKQVHLDGAGGNGLLIRLGMSGQILLDPTGTCRLKHRHASWTLERGENRFLMHFVDPRRFGGLFATMDPEDLESRFWSKLGPDGLSITSRALAKALGRTSRCLKAALLDQGVIAGLGNIYVDESLHLAQLSPLRASNTLTIPESALLTKSIRGVLRAACKAGGTTFRDYRTPSGDQGDFVHNLQVYGRQGESCLSCGSHLVSDVVAARTTVWCGVCQKELTKDPHVG